MRIISFTQARSNLKSVLDGVVNDADCTVITRRDAENAVIMSMEYYDGLMETVHLLKSPANAAHLAKSIEQYKMGSTTERDIINEPTISLD
jgi:antitoxin YefM